VKPQLPNNENDQNRANAEGCSVCRELLVNLGRFLEKLEAVRDSHRSDWLTVEEIAREFKLSKSIVCRLIRNDELEAKKVKPPPSQPTRLPARRFPKVKNHLGL